MSQQFKRQVRVELHNDGEIIRLNPDLDIRFSCRKDRSTVPNELEVIVRNLSPDTRKFAQQTNAQLLIYAGYQDKQPLLAHMDIERAVTEWQPPDALTTFQCLDGLKPLKDKKAKVSFKKGASVRQIVEKLLAQLDLPYRIYEVNLNVPLKGSFSHDGGIGDALYQVLDKAGAVWGIVNNTVIISALGKGIGQPVLTLTPQNGLLAQPEELESTVISERVVEKRLPPTGYQIHAFLRGELNPFDKIRIESRNVSGEFVIDTVEHIGGNRVNEFLTRCTVYESGGTG